MIYRILMDGQDIFNPQDRRYALISPGLKLELNTAGSLEFTMHPAHTFYDAVRPMTSYVEVLENEVSIWMGRVVEVTVDFYNQKRVYCEGALAYFNDSVQRPHEYESVSHRAFLEDLVAAHNAQVDAEKQFTVGTVNFEDESLYRKLNYESTYECLKKMCLGAEGGYLRVYRQNGVNMIDWVTGALNQSNQPVEFGLNLLSYKAELDFSGFCTCVLPLGDEVEGVTVTVESVNGGSDIVVSEAAQVYGKIVRKVDFSGVTEPSELLRLGQEYLENTQFDDMMIECVAADLHFENENYDTFQIYQQVHMHSVPHLIDRYFDIMQMTIDIATTQKSISLGMRRQTLTEIVKEPVDMGVSVVAQEEIETIFEEIRQVTDDLQDITKPPDIEGIRDDIDVTLQDIRDLLEDEDFDEAIRKRAEDEGIPVIDFREQLGDYLDDIDLRLGDADNWDDLQLIDDDVNQFWDDYGDMFRDDSGGGWSGGERYENINNQISGNSSTIAGATDNKSLAEVKAQIKKIEGDVTELRQRIDSLRDYQELLEPWRSSVDAKLEALERDHFVHQIDGVAVESGMVNFVTTM